ncbi:MAG: hypothetical protein KA313_03000 [Pseudarcicella sp.]|nr:hypothetical protein [Pseudarcicella sp.]
MRKTLSAMLLSCIISSCNQTGMLQNVEKAFFYWKSNSSIDDESQENFKKLKAQKLYFKVFEIGYSPVKGNFPFEKQRLTQEIYQNLDSALVVPTIFVKNDIFAHNNEKTLDQLAENIVFLVEKFSKNENDETQKVYSYDEIQIDCDWTKSTQEKYFYLLKKIKELSDKQLSCTLRLYPYKFSDEMGVPPVDKAMLMCYNLIKPLAQKNKNSILDLDELKKYLIPQQNYPLHLDIALPVFNWNVLYQNNQFVKLLNISPQEVKSFTQETEKMWYTVRNDTSLNYGQTYLRKGDQIKIEEINKQTLNEAIAILKQNVVFEKNTTVSLFDLDINTFKQYNNEELANFYNSFTK